MDRLLIIWQEILKIHPDWTLDIYGTNSLDLKNTADQMGITSSISFFEPVQNIEDCYRNTSIYLITSRFEAFPMVLLEAMACGLPCIAYDCPCGPKAIIDEGETGFLIEDNNVAQFVKQLDILMKDENLRGKMGEKAKLSTQKYNLETIMKIWHEFFIEIKK